MSDAEPWLDVPEESLRYESAEEHQEFEKAKEIYTNAWNIKDKEPGKAKELFEEAAKGFESCNAPRIAEKVRAKKNSLSA